MKWVAFFVVLVGAVFCLPVRADEVKDRDAAQIATGYASAFAAMRRSYVTILYKTPDALERIEGVKQITAYGGAILVRTTFGKEQVLDATRVVKILER